MHLCNKLLIVYVLSVYSKTTKCTVYKVYERDIVDDNSKGICTLCKRLWYSLADHLSLSDEIGGIKLGLCTIKYFKSNQNLIIHSNNKAMIKTHNIRRLPWGLRWWLMEEPSRRSRRRGLSRSAEGIPLLAEREFEVWCARSGGLQRTHRRTVNSKINKIWGG